MGVYDLRRRCGWGELGEAEDVVEPGLRFVEVVGGAAAYARPALPPAGRRVDEGQLVDLGEGAEDLLGAVLDPCPARLALDQVHDHERERAVEGVHLELLVGPVEGGREGGEDGVLQLAEAPLRLRLGAGGGDDLLVRPLLAVAEDEPLARSSASRRASACASMRKRSLRAASSPSTRRSCFSQRGRLISSIRAVSLRSSIRCLPRSTTRRNSHSCRRALSSVWARPRRWRAWKRCEWLMTTVRSLP